MNFYDVIIIGAGPAGMLAAIEAGRAGLSVLLMDHNRSYGKKLSITGNGRCNFTNLYQASECYRGADIARSYEIVEDFGPDKIIDFMKTLGVEIHKRHGREFDVPEKEYIYPASESAADLSAALVSEIECLRIKKKTMLHAVGVKKTFDTEHGKYLEVVTAPYEEGKTYATGKYDNTFSYSTRFVLAATGGLAAPETGSDGSFFEFVNQAGIKTAEFAPALTKILIKEDLTELAGLRAVGRISLFDGNGRVSEDTGELQFADHSVSGIPAMQVSRFVRSDSYIVLDFFPEIGDNELISLLADRRNVISSHRAEDFFKGLLPAKQSEYVIKRLKFRANSSVSEISDEALKDACKLLKHMKLAVSGTGSFREAQVTRGGILLSELTDSLESKAVPGLYFAGEMLDTDAICGGYNLTWAFASAHTAISDIKKKVNER